MGELHLMLNQLGSGSISCLRPAVETERLVRYNERQNHRSVLFLWTYCTDRVYLEMLKQFVYPQVAFQPSIILSIRWGSPRWNMDVRRSINETYPNWWIGRDGTICWPSRSSDLIPLDFLLCVYVKDRVFTTPVNDIGELQARIHDVIATITSEMLAKNSKNLSTCWILFVLPMGRM